MAGSERSAGNASTALCMGGVFAISAVIPAKVQQLVVLLRAMPASGIDAVAHTALQLLGCFVLLSVLIWASKTEPRSVRPLLAYPPHNRDTVLVHALGLIVGVVMMLVA